MTTYFISESDLTSLLDALSERGEVLTSRSATDSDYVTYAPRKKGQPFEYTGFRATASLKGLLFPEREKVAEYPAESPEAPEPSAPPVVVGAANCDVKGLASLDAVFLSEDFLDGFYAQRRRKLLVITQDCTNPRPSCACTYLGFKPYPEEGFDLNLSRVEGGYVVEIGSEKGRELVEGNSASAGEATQEMLAERDSTRLATLKAVEEINKDYQINSSRRELLALEEIQGPWNEEVSKCVECAACLFACPTCHCFLLYDQRVGETNERVKAWDACSYAGYARMAGGGTPRAFLLERFRHRYMHKFDYFVENYGFEMCSGCGRCIEGCAGKIDMRKLFKALESSAAPAR